MNIVKQQGQTKEFVMTVRQSMTSDLWFNEFGHHICLAVVHAPENLFQVERALFETRKSILRGYPDKFIADKKVGDEIELKILLEACENMLRKHTQGFVVYRDVQIQNAKPVEKETKQ